MPYRILIVFLLVAGCAVKNRQPSSAEVVPEGALTLDLALAQGPGPTLAYLRSKATLESYPGMKLKDPALHIPEFLKAGKPAPVAQEKRLQRKYIGQFRTWSLPRKLAKSQELLSQFDCEKSIETQSLGFSMELDFPETTAVDTALSLHEKVLACENLPRNESFFRLAIFNVHKGECPKAMTYLNRFPRSDIRGVNDRLAYLRSLCPDVLAGANGNPWGGYGILLMGDQKLELTRPANWYLSTTSGSVEWDRLLVSFLELLERGQYGKVQYLASRLDYEKLRALPLSFQTSMLVMMHFSGADLSVFQTLHRYLSEHPENLSSSLTGLLFPTRYWNEILQNAKSTDPILVKALIRQESAFNPAAQSGAKAIGLMQLVYPTARIFGVKNRAQLLKPEVNIRAGSEFLGRLIEDFGSVELALAAYNAGPGMVRQWQRRYPTTNINLFVEMIPYTETREYVRLVSRNYKIYQSLLTVPPQVDREDVEKTPPPQDSGLK